MSDIRHLVVHDEPLDAVWVALARRMAEDGFRLCFSRSGRTVSVKKQAVPRLPCTLLAARSPRQARVHVALHETSSHGALTRAGWSATARDALASRPHLLSFETSWGRDDAEAEFVHAVFSGLAELLDGLCFEDSVGRLTSATHEFERGKPDVAITSEGVEPEADWASVSSRGTLVLECPVPFSPAQLLTLARRQYPFVLRAIGALDAHAEGFGAAKKSTSWREIVLGADVASVALQRVSRVSQQPAAVRARLELHSVDGLAVAHALFSAARAALRLRLIDFEPG